MMNDALGHFQAGRPAEAARLLGTILTIDSRHADSLHLLGVIAYQGGHLDDAIGLIGHALRITPDNPYCHYNLGSALHRQGKIDAAIEQYQQAITLRPDYADAHNNLGSAFLATGRPDDAITHYRRTIAINPAQAEAHNNVGNLLKERGAFDEALEHLRKALALMPNRPERPCTTPATPCRPRAGRRMPSRITGRRWCSFRTTPMPTTISASRWRLWADSDEAEEHYAQALAIEPDHPEVHNNLGSAFKDQGRFSEALVHFGRALAAMPNYVERCITTGAEIRTFHPGDAELTAPGSPGGRNDQPPHKAMHIHFAMASTRRYWRSPAGVRTSAQRKQAETRANRLRRAGHPGTLRAYRRVGLTRGSSSARRETPPPSGDPVVRSDFQCRGCPAPAAL